MSLSKKEKQRLKQLVKMISFEQAVKELKIESQAARRYLEKIWGKEKFKKTIALQKEKNSLYSQAKFKPFKKEWWQKNWPILTFLTILVMIVYSNSLGNEFLSDDIAVIKDHPLINQFSYISQSSFNFRSTLIFLTNKIFGLQPAFFRLSNVLSHLGSVWVIYLLLRKFFRAPIPLFAASIFAVHPILTEGVTWISGGPYSNSVFFILLALLAYLYEGYPAAVIFFLIGSLFSEKVFYFPAILFLYEISLGDLKKNWKKLIPHSLISAAWLLYLMGLVGVRTASLENTYYMEPGLNNPLIQIPVAITSYLELIFWPKNLTFYHSELQFSQLEYFVRLGIFLAFIALIVYLFKKSRTLFFWLVFFFIPLSPTLTPLRVAWTVAERYAYLAVLGIFVVIAFGIKKIGDLVKNPKVAYLIFALVITAFSVRTISRNRDWRNQDSLWLATGKTSPSSHQNHNNLGDMYARHGDYQKAEEHFLKAIELKPNYADAYHNLANIYHQVGRDDLAEEYYQKALEFNPQLWQSHQNLAALYFLQERPDLSLEQLLAAIGINPNNAELYTNLAITYQKLGQVQEAKQVLQKALSLDPQHQKTKQLLINLQ